MRQLTLGRWVRGHYRTFLSTDYAKEEVVIRSTDVDRCLMSGEVHLAGLYPPTRAQVWSPDIKWQPIPIHTVPEQQDTVTMLLCYCLDTAKRYLCSKLEIFNYNHAVINRINY